MTSDRPTAYKGVGPSQANILESYISAFPGVDIDALTANLALATLSTFLREGFEAKMRSMGYELSRPRYTLVRTLYLTPNGTLPKAEIADAMRVSGAYVTQLLLSLEADGWVTRVRDRADSRVTHVYLTEVGKERCSKLVPTMLGHMVDVCKVLNKNEIEQLLDMITRITARDGPPAANNENAKGSRVTSASQQTMKLRGDC
jgi:DNA-binding MarR family transcriptional regulator